MEIDTTMFSYLFLVCLFINSVFSQREDNQCVLLNKKLIEYNINLNSPSQDLPVLRLCQGLAANTCCPQIYESAIQNATALELYHRFELSTISLYEPLLRLSTDINDTFIKLIEIARNETHLVLQRGYNKLYHSYRLSIDQFFNHLLTLTYRTYPHDVTTYVDQLFRNILHISLTLSNQKTILPNYFSCLWKNQPFGNQLNLLDTQLQTNLGKLFQLKELFQLSQELIQVVTTSVTTDYHCIDSYMQLSYCNLCGGRRELPCLSNCINVIESCLVNSTLIDQTWRDFLDALENRSYFNSIEKVLSSIGLSISDAVMTFFNSGGVQNKDIIDQCGHLRLRRQTFAIDHTVDEPSTSTLSLSFLDRQLSHISRSLNTYRAFWVHLPTQICQSTRVSARNGSSCWTGTSISEDGRSSVRPHYDKPLNLKLQRILKEMKQKSQTIGYLQRSASVFKANPSTSSSPPINLDMQNLTDTVKSDEVDDYPNDNDMDYSDYAYEDSTIEMTKSSTTTVITTITTTTTTIRTTTTHRSTTTIDPEEDDDETNTAYYDYGDHDVYSDDEGEDLITTTEGPVRILTTRRTTTNEWRNRIPYYHRRPVIIWNVNTDDNEHQKLAQQRNSGSSLSYSLLYLLTIFISRV